MVMVQYTLFQRTYLQHLEPNDPLSYYIYKESFVERDSTNPGHAGLLLWAWASNVNSKVPTTPQQQSIKLYVNQVMINILIISLETFLYLFLVTCLVWATFLKRLQNHTDPTVRYVPDPKKI